MANLAVRLFWRGRLLVSEEFLQRNFEDDEELLPMLAHRSQGPLRPTLAEIEFLDEADDSETRFFRLGKA